MWQPKNILVTGAAGFIGFHLSRKLLDNGINVVGLDNLNDYYDPKLKQARLNWLTPHPSFIHVNIDVADRPVDLMRYIETLEDCLGRKAKKNFLPMQKADVPATCANVDDLVTDVDFRPDTPIESGISNFVGWYREFYKI